MSPVERNSVLLAVSLSVLLLAEPVFAQQGDQFSVNTGNPQGVDNRRQLRQQYMQRQGQAEENQDRNSIIITGEPLNRKRGPQVPFASDYAPGTFPGQLKGGVTDQEIWKSRQPYSPYYPQPVAVPPGTGLNGGIRQQGARGLKNGINDNSKPTNLQG